eukprot:m.10294 g.10294  ORF g.10294 m.10294 type:complete len:219 (+) comp5855_c0_seq2:17-673(+)
MSSNNEMPVAAAAAAASGGGRGMEIRLPQPELTFEQQKERLLVRKSEQADSSLVSSYATRRVGDPSDIVALAQFVNTANNFTKATVSGKLELICDQIRGLQEQARRVLESAQRDVELTNARCNFVKKPGSIYHLYRRTHAHGESETFFSMLSPGEWGDRQPADTEFVESYRLEFDMSYTPLPEIHRKDNSRRIDPVLLGLAPAQMGDEEVQAIELGPH